MYLVTFYSFKFTDLATTGAFGFSFLALILFMWKDNAVKS